MLLALIDLIAAGEVTDNRFPVSTHVVEAFLKYWNLLRIDKPAIYLPIYYLQSDGLWRLTPIPGATIQRPSSMAELKRHVAFGSLDERLFELLLDANSRAVIREALILRHFPSDANLFRAAANEGRDRFELESLLESADTSAATFERPKRNRLFRAVIMRLYDFTCAACRHRVLTIEGVTAAEAAHIIPFSVTQDDRIGNGLALCKLHHWAFDTGLISVGESFELLVSDKFDETGDREMLFNGLRDRPIRLPSASGFHPLAESLTWHRENRFQG